MKIHEFANLVKQMRDSQKTYFRLRKDMVFRLRKDMEVGPDVVGQALSTARELERRVDKAIEDVTNAQKRLF